MVLTLLVTFSLAFVVTHLVMSHGSVRERLRSRLGPGPFKGVYSLVSFATLGPAAVLFWKNRHLGPVLWQLPHGLAVAAALLTMLFGLLLLVLGFASPSPVGMIPAKAEVRGVLRITRHPANMGFACFGLAHVLANGALGDVAFFGSFVALGVVGAFHQDARIRKARGSSLADFFHRTSVLPFVAIARRRTRFAAAELPFPMVAVAVVLWALLAFFHGRLFGMPLW